MHKGTNFDAIISFGLLGAGGLAWRIARELDIPACGWATGSDVRVSRSSGFGRSVVRALQRLDVIFYQSRELWEIAASLLGMSPDRMAPERHLILPRGIPEPPTLGRDKLRKQVRTELKIASDAIVVLNVGRVSQEKGIWDLLEAAAIVGFYDPGIIWVMVGSMPAFDDSAIAQKKLEETAELRDRVRLVTACPPEKIWEYLCAADIFVFTSHNEGMPNSLLEAMAMGVPSVAFAIPPVREIEAGTGVLVLVPTRDTQRLAEGILRLASSPDERSRLGERGKQRVRERFMVKANMAAAIRRLAMSQNERTRRISKADE
jgi:glycosyltransferase involved in cell wall biosynthesis